MVTGLPVAPGAATTIVPWCAPAGRPSASIETSTVPGPVPELGDTESHAAPWVTEAVHASVPVPSFDTVKEAVVEPPAGTEAANWARETARTGWRLAGTLPSWCVARGRR